MFHAFKGIFVNKVLDLFLASYDRGTRKSEFFRQRFLNTLFQLPYTPGWTFKYHIATGNDSFDIRKTQLLKNPS